MARTNKIGIIFWDESSKGCMSFVLQECSLSFLREAIKTSIKKAKTMRIFTINKKYSHLLTFTKKKLCSGNRTKNLCNFTRNRNGNRNGNESNPYLASRVAQWSKGLTIDPGAIPGCVAACRDWETHEAVHNWPHGGRVRGGFGRLGCHALATPCGGRAHARWLRSGFPPTHWWGGLPG